MRSKLQTVTGDFVTRGNAIGIVLTSDDWEDFVLVFNTPNHSPPVLFIKNGYYLKGAKIL